MAYRVLLTESAEASYLAIPDAHLAKIDKALDVLHTFPEVGTIYDPIYPAARIPFEVRVLYSKPYGVYYTFDEAASTVIVRYIEDGRMDPETRFQGKLGIR